jgi:V/A-type H+-transporting ATPase subunit I
MIVPMIKYNFVMHNSDLPLFLEELQSLGVVDVQRQSRPVDEYSTALMEEVVRCMNTYKNLARINIENPEPASHPYTVDHILKRTEELLEEKHQMQDRMARLIIDVDLARPWEEWELSTIEQLSDLGLKPHFYVIPEKKYNPALWEKDYIVQEMSRCKGKIYFVVLEKEGESYNFPLHEAKFPAAPVDALETELENVKVRLVTIQRKLEKYAQVKEQLQERRMELVEKLELYLAGKSSQLAAADTVVVLTAFIPENQKESLDQFIEDKPIVHLSEMATAVDNPPIQLKNNKFSRLFEPIGSMFMPPKYDEMDVTVFFSPFYMLFFGFCLGDLGYGLVILLLATIAKFIIPKKMQSILSMVQWLGVGAMVMPLISGTFFGVKLGDLFNINGVFLDDLQMFWFAIAFGAFQIIFAKIVHAFDLMKRQGWQAGMSSLGWGLLMISGGLTVGRSFLHLPIPSLVVSVVLYSSLAMILFFSSPSKNIFVRIGKGVASFYDVTGLFGDLLSYIRLFGLATSGGILGFVINTVGTMCFHMPYVGYVVGGLVLIVGHLFVLALCSLSAFVHPMRLTFVEFYKNIGFEGGGRAYNPLKKKN